MSSIPPDQIKKILNKNGIPEPIEYDISLDSINSFGGEETVREIYSSMAAYNKMLKERITFITPKLTHVIPFTRENLYLICAYSGSGKSTIAANVSYSLWKEGKKTLVISNEESSHDIIMRIACIDQGVNFNDYKKGNMPILVQKQCTALFPDIMNYVKVMDVNFQSGATTSVEGVKKMLETVKSADFSCVMIDYWQLIKRSDNNPGAKTYDVLNDLRIWLGQYIKRSNIPIVMFAQLHSMAKRQNKDLDSRIKHCPDIYEPSTVVIEAVPNWENKTTDIIIHKDRFGFSGQQLTIAFDKGRFVDVDEDVLRKIQETKAAELDQKISEEKLTI